MAASACATAGYAWLAGPLLSRFQDAGVSQRSLVDPGQSESPVNLSFGAIVLLLLFLGLLRTGFETARGHVSARLQQSVVFEIRGKILEHVLSLTPAALARWSHGALASRVQVEVHGLRAMLHFGLAQGVRSVLVATALAIVALKVDTTLAISGLLMLPVALLLVIAGARPARRLQSQLMDVETALVASTADAVDGALVLRAYGASAAEGARIGRLADRSRQQAVRTETWGTLAAPLVELAAALGVAGAIGFAWSTRGGLDLASTTTVLVALLLMYRPLFGLAQSVFGWSAGLACLDRIDELLRLPVIPEPTSGARGTAIPISRISVDAVTFAYGSHAVLSGANWIAHAGELVVVTGESGAGKSTLLALLSGVLEPDRGEVRRDGRPIAASERIATTSWMSQTPQLFRGTLAANLTLGDPRPDRARMLDAARRAGVDAFVHERPHGYEALVEDRGENLSVGQRQRIAFARALYKTASVLLLDEPTSALDRKNIARVLDACRASANEGKLVIVATHEPNFIEQADRVVEVVEGDLRRCEERDARPLLH